MSLTVSALCVATSVSNRLFSILNGKVSMWRHKIMSRVVLSSPPQTPRGTTAAWVVVSPSGSSRESFLTMLWYRFWAGLQRTVSAFEAEISDQGTENQCFFDRSARTSFGEQVMPLTNYESREDDGCDWSLLMVDKIIIISTRHSSH